MISKKLILSFIIGLLFTIFTLFLAFRNIPILDVMRYFRTIHYIWAIPAAIFAFLSFILRVIRWRLVLSSIKKTSFSNCYHALMTGFMVNCILPGRAGELVRPAVFMKKEHIPFTTCIATMVTERVFDMICLISMLAIVLTIVHIDPGLTVNVGKYHLTGAILSKIGSGMTKLCILVVTGAVLISMKSFRNGLNTLIIKSASILFFLSERSRNNIRDKVLHPLAAMVDHFADGLTLLKKPIKVTGCLILSISIWLVQAFSYHMMTFACPGLTLTFFQTMAMMIMVCFFIALPSVPGYWGLWEAGGIFGLSLFSVAGDQAAGYTLINHVVQIMPVIIAGLISAIAIGLDFKVFLKQNQTSV